MYQNSKIGSDYLGKSNFITNLLFIKRLINTNN